MIKCNSCFEEYDESLGSCPHCEYVPGTPPKELSHLYPGTELADRYIIGSAVGFGGFGITYKAWDKKLSLVVAVKEYYPSGIVNRVPGTKEVVIYARKREKEFNYGKTRFLDEARNMAKFNSEPNIINVFEYFEENNTAYIVMEFLNRLLLSGYMHTNGGKLDVDTGLEIAQDIGNALIKIHSKGIVHRDVSPDNIFLCLGGGMKLIDFGAARFSQDENKLMTIILKPGFAPPEQYEKINEQGPWTDVYALGATLYYVLTGEKPEESTNRKIKDSLPYPHQIENTIPVNLSNAIMKAMAVELHMRYKNVEEFMAAIKSDKKVVSVETEKKRRRGKRIAGICVAALILGMGITVSSFSWKNEKEEETLPDGTIVMWYCKSGDEELDAAEESAYQTIIEDFNKSFPNVTIDLQGFSAEEYTAKLTSSDTQPDIYEYTGTKSSGKGLSLESIYSSDTAKSCSLLKDVKNCYGNYDFLPLGFNIPVIYENTALYDFSDESVSELKQLNDSVVFDNAVFLEMYSNSSEYLSDDAREQFYSENVGFYLTTTDTYYEVTQQLPAQYKMLFCNTQKVYCNYDNLWAANDSGESSNKAELKLLEFMLNNNAQDTLHIQNQCNSLPVNDSVLDIFVSVYDDFDGLFDNKENYVFENQGD